MKRLVLICSFFLLSVFIIVPQVVAAHYPTVDFIQKVSYKTTADGVTPEIFVDALDINGTRLFLIKNNQKVIPIIKLGTTVLTVLYSGMITDSSTGQQQVIVQLPSPLINGSYNVDINNGDRLGGFIVTLGVVGPAGPTGPLGPAGPAGNTSTKAFVNFNGADDRSDPVIRAQSGISTITRTAVGEYTITFSNPFADRNYVMTGNASNGSVFIRTVTRSHITIYILDTEGRPVNPMRVMLHFTSL